MKKSQRAGVGTTAFGALAAVAVLAAPNANALVTGVSVAGVTFCAGDTYTVTVETTVTSFLFDVTLTDNGVEIGKKKPSDSKAVFSWTPASPGEHTLEAVQEVISKKSVTVAVEDCTPPPTGGDSGSAVGSGGLGALLPSLSAGD
ncbi:hypothetical protein IU449_11390 [Nocardia higoensis]|uniref:Uncharacterized protein n=1 Tax=Nocardia higoensis TaxID=228599 RepID=A0ABS0D9P4_9NOCA|nr:hypothetical protein [Nocardia higoensis]MBF6355136.1 hypothetical protein [Nocardia higoensis]